jgi:hypothetical protein
VLDESQPLTVKQRIWDLGHWFRTAPFSGGSK